MANPLVSIVMPVYNAAPYLLDAINSVESQTYKDWRLTIVDDCSTDESRQLIDGAMKNNPRINAIYLKENSGVSIARNAGIEKSKDANYLAFLDADDLWVPAKLEKQVSLLGEMINSTVIYSGYEFVDSYATKTGVIVNVPETMSVMELYGNHLIWTSTVIVNLNNVAIEDIFMIDIGFGEDITTWWRLLSKYGDARGINEPLAMYRRTKGSLSANKFSILAKKWRVFKYAENLNFAKRGYYYSMSVYNAVRKRV